MFLTVQAGILPAIATVTDLNVTHVVYSHFHADHIGATGLMDLPEDVEIIAHQWTADKLAQRAVSLPFLPLPPSPPVCRTVITTVSLTDREILSFRG